MQYSTRFVGLPDPAAVRPRLVVLDRRVDVRGRCCLRRWSFPPEAPLELIERLLRLLPDGQDPLRGAVEDLRILRKEIDPDRAIISRMAGD